jgi:hypothetical protein
MTYYVFLYSMLYLKHSLLIVLNVLKYNYLLSFCIFHFNILVNKWEYVSHF